MALGEWKFSHHSCLSPSDPATVPVRAGPTFFAPDLPFLSAKEYKRCLQALPVPSHTPAKVAVFLCLRLQTGKFLFVETFRGAQEPYLASRKVDDGRSLSAARLALDSEIREASDPRFYLF